VCAVVARLNVSAVNESGFFAGINMSARQLAQPALLEFVRDCLSKHSVDPGQLMIEVTEDTLMSEPAALEVLAEMRALGARVAIDDFGTGYSSLAYLRHMPVDVLKMDRQFVADLPDSGALAQTIVGLANALKLELIAEGIETEVQAHVLRSMSCTLGQGYLFAHPLSEAELKDYFAVATVAGADPKALAATR
jgi:EAL domain-containing protein (putative c-di-GMP-specific phosphodiesterase class I)